MLCSIKNKNSCSQEIRYLTSCEQLNNIIRVFYNIGDKSYLPCSFAQLSFNETVRLNTNFSGVESKSTLK